MESLFDQMQQETTQHMASILKSTDSAYYPSFQNMMSKVMAALSEALDVTLYLEPLIEHFNVSSHDELSCVFNFQFNRPFRARTSWMLGL